MQKTFLSVLLVLNFTAFAQMPPPTYGVIPAERQLQWQAMEQYALVHFTPTTFENKEWGYGDANPAIFNPTNFDADQIVRAAQAGGLKGLILVAKHHDGFCLWPTKTTNYNISKSPWKNGKGDMVREFEQACRRNGMKFGVYCSPWDRNDAQYGTPAYVQTYRDQLRELYTNYGDLFISWHDGANGGDGYYGGADEKRKIDNTTYYDWETTWMTLTRKLQPNAVIFSDIGWDVRWVGNEKGYAAETYWATFSPFADTGNVVVPGNVNTDNSNSGTRNGLYWIPAECDVPLRKGWFYHSDQDVTVKTPEQLFDLYLKSVGRGACLDLGLAPTPEGQLHPIDVANLKAYGELVKKIFANNLAKDAKLTASNFRNNTSVFSVKSLVDNDLTSYWATDDAVHSAELLIELPYQKEVSFIQIKENIALGQRIENATVEMWENNSWKKIAEVNSVGANRIMRFEAPVDTHKFRLRFSAPAALCISEVGLY